jgi:hypothetical protein
MAAQSQGQRLICARSVPHRGRWLVFKWLVAQNGAVMARWKAYGAVGTLFWLVGSGCQVVLGNVDVVPAPPEGAPRMADLMGNRPAPPARPYTPSRIGVIETPAGGPVLGGLTAGLDAGVPVSSDGGTVLGVDAAAPPPPVPLPVRQIVVDGPASELAQIGADGGQPHLGSCAGGLAIGVRSTVNPSEEVFGRRQTFVEPICATAFNEPGTDIADTLGARVTLVRDESILNWDTTGDFQGPPPTDVPDPRLVWVVQPATLCPDAAPALVGLSGRYDPVAPDSTATAAIRSVVLECAPLVLADNGVDLAAADSGHQLISQADGFPETGTDAYRSACEGGSVLTQIHVHAGFWLDGFALGCSTLRSPKLAGEPCQAERECQSGVCSADASCAP